MTYELPRQPAPPPENRLPEAAQRVVPSTLAADSDQGPGPSRLAVSQATRLRDLLADYYLFTPAVLLSTSGLVRDVVQEFLNSCQDPGAIEYLLLESPVFSGLAASHPVWDNLLFVSPARHWAACRRFFGTIGAFHPPGRDGAPPFLARATILELRVADALEYQHHGTYTQAICDIPLTVFGTSSSYGEFGLSQPQAVTELPRLYCRPPLPAMRALAEQVAGGPGLEAVAAELAADPGPSADELLRRYQDRQAVAAARELLRQRERAV